MKNLKRVLSMGLASVMLLGMMVMGVSAAETKEFTDASEIQKTEAVTTMAALNVINGKDNGSFDPKGNVTRGEMAKMITIMLNGGQEPVLATGSTPKFSDTANHWARKYIEYCAAEQQGVIAGRGDGTFAPDAPVTGTEAAKMVLTALEYNSKVFGFVGADWEVNVNYRANTPEVNVYDTLDTLNPSNALTRDQAAQMLYNALDAHVVKVIYEISSNGTSETYDTKGGKTMMQDKFGATKVEGIVIANDYANLADEYVERDEDEDPTTTIQVTSTAEELAGTSYVDKAEGGELVLDIDTGLDVLGRAVNVYLRHNNRTGEDEIIGGVVVSSKNSVTIGTAGKAPADLKSKGQTIKSGEWVWFENYEPTEGTKTITKPDHSTETVDSFGAETIDSVKPGDTVILVSNDGKSKSIEYVFVVKYTLDEVYSISTKNETIRFRAAGNYKYGKIVGEYEDLEKDDTVLTTVVNEKVLVETPATVTGELEAYKNNTNSKIISLTVEGNKYDVSWADIANKTDLTGLEANGRDLLNDQLDKDHMFYIDANGKIVAMGAPEEAAANYAISWGGADSNVIDAGRIKMTLADGTTKIYNISEDSDWVIAADSTQGGKELAPADATDNTENIGAVGIMITYSFDDNGDIKIVPVSSDFDNDTNVFDNDDTVTFTKGKTLVGTTTGGKKTSYATGANTPFFFVTTRGADASDYVDGTFNPSEGSVKKVEVFTGYANTRSVSGVKDAAQLAVNGEKANAVSFINYKGTKDEADVSNHLYVVSVDRTYTNYVTADVYFAGSDELQEGVKLNRNQDLEQAAKDELGVSSSTKLSNEQIAQVYEKEGIFLYTEDTNERYNLEAPKTNTDPQYYFKTQEVGKTSNISVELGAQEGDKKEYFITDESVIIGRDEDGKPEDALLGGGVYAGTVVDVLVDTKTETVLMLVVRTNVPEASHGTLDSNITADEIKAGADGVYAPTGNKYADDIAGKACDNIVVKFTTTKDNQKVKITITKSGSDTPANIGNIEFTFATKGGHFIYQNIAGEGDVTGTGFTADLGATYNVKVVDADDTSVVLLEGDFVRAK